VSYKDNVLTINHLLMLRKNILVVKDLL